jgi:hypothetical protein
VVGSSAVLEQIPAVMGDELSAPALLFVALGMAAVFALAFAAEPLLTRLGEKGVSRLPAVDAGFCQRRGAGRNPVDGWPR